MKVAKKIARLAMKRIFMGLLLSRGGSGGLPYDDADAKVVTLVAIAHGLAGGGAAVLRRL